MANLATLPVARPETASIVEAVILKGDLSRLTPEERVSYYRQTCESLGLNPLTRPFEYVRLSGKEVLYARRDCADQLRKIHRVSLQVTSAEELDGLYVVTARATLPDGRSDEDVGAVSIRGLQGEARANAMLKAVTKAKRRVTLSICGLGWLDESEVEAVQAVERQEGRPALAGNPAPCKPKLSPEEWWSRESLEIRGTVSTALPRLINAIRNAPDRPRLDKLLQDNEGLLTAAKRDGGYQTAMDALDEKLDLLTNPPEPGAVEPEEEGEEPAEDKPPF